MIWIGPVDRSLKTAYRSAKNRKPARELKTPSMAARLFRTAVSVGHAKATKPLRDTAPPRFFWPLLALNHAGENGCVVSPRQTANTAGPSSNVCPRGASSNSLINTAAAAAAVIKHDVFDIFDNLVVTESRHAPITKISEDNS